MFSQVHFFDILHARLLWTTPSLDNEKLSVVIQAYTKKQLASEPSPPNTKEWFNDGIFRRLWSLLPLFPHFCPFLPFSSLFITFRHFLPNLSPVVTLRQIYLLCFTLFGPFFTRDLLMSILVIFCHFWWCLLFNRLVLQWHSFC